MIALFSSMLCAYLLGSMPPSYLLGKWLKGIDLREHGSGNVGATNAFRVLGKGPGIATLLLDIGKGFFAIRPLAIFFENAFSIPMDPTLYRILMGLAVITGHNWTLFLRFKGGKGVATSFGVFLALAPKGVLLVAILWLLVTLLTRKVALGSLAGALFAPFAMLLTHESFWIVIFSFLMGVTLFYTHRSNIKKIFFEKKS